MVTNRFILSRMMLMHEQTIHTWPILVTNKIFGDLIPYSIRNYVQWREKEGEGVR